MSLYSMLDYCTLFWLIDRDTSTTEMTFSTCLLGTHNSNAFFQESQEISPDETYMLIPNLPDVCLKLSKHLLDWVEVGRIRRQVLQYHSCIVAHLLYFLQVVERRVIHYQDRFWGRPPTTV
jgi:hypothetical protein